MADLSVTFCGIKFENPFVLAPSPCTDELEMVQRGLQAGWAGAVLKSTHAESIVFEPVSPLLKGWDFEEKKMVGLGNIDLNSRYPVVIVEERVRQLKKEFPGKVIIASTCGIDKETWQEPTKRLVTAGADIIECATSCPQGHVGMEAGRALCEDLPALKQVVGWVKEAAGSVPVIVTIIGEFDNVAAARAIKEAGGDAARVVGMRRAIMGVDLDTFIPYPNVAGKTTYAGYSGPAIKPISLRVVCEVAREVRIPIEAGGGAMTWQDVLEFMLLGAGIVQFAGAVMRNGFRIIDDLKEGVETYLDEKHIAGVSELIGKSLACVVTQNELSREYRVVSTINRETCIKCDLCYIACSDGGHMAIELDGERIPIVDEEKCVGCGLCQIVCPVWDCVTLKAKTS